MSCLHSRTWYWNHIFAVLIKFLVTGSRFALTQIKVLVYNLLSTFELHKTPTTDRGRYIIFELLSSYRFHIKIVNCEMVFLAFFASEANSLYENCKVNSRMQSE